jgi:hypothetical protein
VLYKSGYAVADVAGRTAADLDQPLLAKPWAMADLLSKVREVLDAPPA